ncbi:MAG: hypothetical protein MRY57_01545 [Candidatus Pacebacteria bacterium]|nr:hypothetical protein [Candidatus Paceibacterota bacterium]
MKRLFILFLLLSVVVFINPIFAILLGLIIGLSMRYAFYEIIIIGVVIDIMYNSMYEFGIITIPIYTIISCIIFLLLNPIKSRLSFHA